MVPAASHGTSSQRLHLITLGDVRLAAAGADPDGTPIFGRGKPVALLTYLALSPKRSASRDHLVDLLWADMDPERGRAALRQTVWLIRQTLGDGTLVGHESMLALGAAVELDRDAFAAAAEAGNAELALELYHGPFLPDLAAPGGVEFEHWADLERRRLHDIYLRALETVARQRLGQLRFPEAVRLARRLRDADPSRETSWRLLLECLLSAGDRPALALEAESAVVAFAEDGAALEPATVSMLERARHLPDPASAETGETELAADLIGREREFAALVAAGALAKSGSATVVHIVGAAGLGKSRLLRDASGRLAALGLRVVYVRAAPGERVIPFSFAATLARAAGTCSGAASVAPETAAILVGLDPKLSSSFSAAKPAHPPPHEAVRVRALALGELLSVVADEQPLALLVDDLHWMDDESYAALGLIAGRLSGARVLFVTAGRPTPERTIAVDRARTLEIQPLTPQQVLELLGSVAAFNSEGWPVELANALHRASHGIPYLALDALESAVERGLLTIGGGAWGCRDTRALLEFVNTGRALDERLQQLERTHGDLLVWLVLAGTPLPTLTLAAAIEDTTDAVEAALVELARRRLVTHVAQGWQLAHDLLADRLTAQLDGARARTAHAHLGRALAGSEVTDPASLLGAARHLMLGGDDRGAALLFRRWVGTVRRLGDRRTARDLAAEFLGDLASHDRRNTLVGALPLRLRLAGSTPLAVGAVGGAAAIGALAWATLAWLGQPVRLSIVEQPVVVGPSGLTPALVAEILDREGRRVVDAHASVAVSAIGVGDQAPLTPLEVPLTPAGGVMRLAKWVVRGVSGQIPEYVRLRVTAPGLAPATTDSVILDQARASRLWLVGGSVNGLQLGPGHRSVSVAPSQDISGVVQLAYSSGWVQAAVLLVGVPTWGDRTRNFFAPFTLPSPTRSGLHQIQLQLVAPPRRGLYHIIFAFAPETEPDYVASATNWTLGKAQWHDGNDIADWTQQQIDEAEQTGHTSAWWTHGFSGVPDSVLARSAHEGRLRLRVRRPPPGVAWLVDVQNVIPATAIDVDVR